MAHTNQTPNYELSQFLGNDKPAWLVDYNGDMEKIDLGLKAAKDVADAAKEEADQGARDIAAVTITANSADSKATQALSNFAEVYDATSTYNVGDTVVYSGLTYKCNTAITIPEPFTGNHWNRYKFSDLSDDVEELNTQYTTTPIIVGKWGNYDVKRVSFSGSLTFGGGAGRHTAIADLSSILTRNTRPVSVKGFYNYTDAVSREQIITIGSTNMSADGLVADASLLRSIDSNSGHILTFETYTSDSISQFSGHYDVTIEYIDMN